LNPADSAASSAPLLQSQTPGVSVVIPAYNYARFLGSAVRSAFAQRQRPVQVIVVDDGSTDDTPALCAALQREFPDLLCIRQQNAGLSAARNTGIRSAAHGLIAFLDADDEWHPEMLDTLVSDLLRQTPGTPLVACNCYRIDASGIPIGEKKTLPRGARSYSARDILFKTRFMPSCAIVRRAAFDAAGLFDTSLRSSEDRDMWVRIASLAPVRYVDLPLVRVRKHGSNMSRNSGRMRAAMRTVRRKAIHANVVPLYHIAFWLPLLAVDHFQGGWMYWDEYRPFLAIWHALLSVLLWPFPLDHRDLHEPPFFRIRAAARFILQAPFRIRRAK